MKYQDLITAASEKYGVRAALIAGVIQHESNWNPDAVGDGGAALGLMQVHRGAAQDTGFSWDELHEAIVVRDEQKAASLGIEIGVAYLALMLKEAHGNERLALAAYNQGPSLIHHPQSKEQLARGLAYADAILGAPMPAQPVIANAAFNATASSGVAGALDTLVNWGLSFFHVAVPPNVDAAFMVLFTSGIAYFLHTRSIRPLDRPGTSGAPGTQV